MVEIIKLFKYNIISYLKILKNTKFINYNYNNIEKKDLNTVRIYKIKNCFFDTRNDFAFDSNGKIISETLDNKARIKNFKKKKFKKKVFFDEDKIVLNLSSEQHFNYYHFIIDILFKLFIFRKLNINNYTIVLPKEKFNGYIKDIFEFFFPREIKKVFLVDKNSYIVCKILYHIESNFDHNFIKFKDYLLFLSKKIKKSKKLSKFKFKKVYISRKLANYRGFKNEKKLITYLSKQGFKILHFENMNILDQFSVFKNSKIILTCHGSALTNLIASNKKNLIIEIHSRIFTDNYLKISQLLNLKNYKNYLLKENRFFNFFDNITEKNKNKIITEDFLNDINFLINQ